MLSISILVDFSRKKCETRILIFDVHSSMRPCVPLGTDGKEEEKEEDPVSLINGKYAVLGCQIHNGTYS